MSDKKVGIVVLNWNSWQETMDCVTSVQQLDYPNHSLYVVDNASEDGSEQRLRAWNPALRIIQSGGNLGWAGGNNVGIRIARAEGCHHVYLLNSDATVRADTLTLLVEAAQRPDAAAVGSLVVSEADPHWVEFAGCQVDPRTRFPRQIHCTLDEMDRSSGPLPIPAVKGCSMLLTQTALDRVGLLSEDYFLNYDETDWCYRASALGLANYFVPAAVVAHKGAVAFQGTAGPLYRYFIIRNRLLFAHRHLDRYGQWFAWRAALWELRSTMFPEESPRQPLSRRSMLLRSIWLGMRDYGLARYGDCPSLVRVLNRRYQESVTGDGRHER
jgi:GT2 family glycosyltransferase